MLGSQGLPRRPSHLTNLYRPVWQRRTRGKGFGKEGRSLGIFQVTLRTKYLLVRARPVAPTLRFFLCVFVYFRLKSGRVIKLAILCRDTRNFVCLIYFTKRASGNKLRV